MITPAFLLILVPIAVYILAREDFANGKYVFYKSRILAITFILILLTPAGLGSTFSMPEAFADNEIKQLIKIAGLYPADVASADFPIDPPLTNLDKSFVFYTVRHTGEDDASDTFKSVEILDVNTLRLKGEDTATGNNAVEFVAFIIEYDSTSEIDVQHLQESIAASAGNQSFTMGSINTTNSMIVSRGQHQNVSATAVGNNDFLRIRIDDPTTWQVNINTAPDTPQGSLVSVIDWNQTDIEVQSGLFTMVNPSSTGELIGGTDFTVIDPTRTMFLFTYTTDGASSEDNDDLMLRGSLTDGGDVRFFRDDDDSELLIAWQLIEFPANFIKIKHFNSTLGTAVLSIDVTVPEIKDFDKTMAISHGGSPFGYSTGSGSNAGEIAGGIDRSQSTFLVTNNTQVQISREDSTAPSEIGWQLIEFLEADEAQNAQGTNTLRQVVKVEDTYTGSSVFQDYTISPSLLTVNNTILFMSIEDASLDTADVSERLKRFGIVDTSTLRIHGSNDPTSSNLPINFTAYLVEFDQSSPIFVQRDQVQYSNGISADELVMHMSPVNQSGSHIQYNAWTSTSGDSTLGQEEFASVRIINDTTWGYDVEQPSDDEESVAIVNIIDWNQNTISVQMGQASLTGTTLSVSPSTDVIRNQTILLVSHRTTNSEFEDEPDDAALLAHLDNSSPPDMIFERDDSADPALLINWQLISFPSDFAFVQHLRHNQTIGTGNATETITAVGNVSKSIAIGTSMSPMGFSNGKATKSDTDQFGEAHGKITLENDTTVRFERGLSTGGWELGFQVIEFEPVFGQDFNQTINNNANVTDAHILNTTKVLGSGVSSGATSACSAGIGTSFLRGCYTFDTADISNDTATNSGTLGTLADAEYFSDSIKSPFVINATGIINQAVLQNGTNDDGTPFAPGRTQGEIRLVNSSNISEFNFIHTLTGSNLTSINFWIFGDVDGAAEYPLITSMSQNAGEDSGMNLHTRGADMCLNLGVNGSFVVNNSCVIGGPIPADDGEWHMVTLLMDKGNTTSFAKIYIDGSSIGTINGNAFSTDVEDSFRELKIGGTEFASSRVETTWFVDDFAIWNGYQLTDSDVDTLFNVEGDEALVTVTDANILNTTKVLNDNANVTDSVATALIANVTLNDNANVTDSITVGLTTTETINGTLNNVTATDSVLFDVIKGLPAGTAPAIFFNSSVPNVANQTDFFTEVSDNGMMGEDITLDNQRPTKVIIANVSGTSTNGTLTMKVFTNVTLDVSTLGDAVLRATSDSFDLSTFDISTNQTLQFNFTSAPFITGSAFGLEMAGLNGSVNLPIDQSNAGGKCFEVKDLVPIANFSKGPKDTLCEQFSFEVYVSNSTSDDVIVTDNVVTSRMATQVVNDTSIATDENILNTTKVLFDTDTTGGGGTTLGVGTVTVGATSPTEYQLVLGANDQIDQSGGMNFLTQLGDDDVVAGNLINLTNAKITKLTLANHGGPFGDIAINGTTNATMQGFVWSNATVDSSKLSDLVVESSTDILDLNDFIFPQVPFNDQGWDNLLEMSPDIYPISLNMTTPVTVTGNDILVGFLFKDIGQNLTSISMKQNTRDLTPNLITPNIKAVCIGNGTAFTDVLSDNCISSGIIEVEHFLFSIAAEKTVSDLSVDTPIAPSKLRGYWTFDDGHVDDQIAMNAGTLGHNADAVMINMTLIANATLSRNSTGLIGASYLHNNCGGNGTNCQFNGTFNSGDFLQVGLFDQVDPKNWSFLHQIGATQNKTATSFWIRVPIDEAEPTGGRFSAISTSPVGVLEDGIEYRFGSNNAEMGITIESNATNQLNFDFDGLDAPGPNQFTFPGANNTDGFGSPPWWDGEWHHIVYNVDKGNQTFPATICLDGTATVGGECKSVPFDIAPSLGLKDPNYTLLFAPLFGIGSQNEEILRFEMDEIAIWEDYQLTDSEIDQIASMAVGAGVTAGAGVIVTDSVNAVLMQGLNQTISNATNFVDVTDEHILNTTKVIDDTDTTGGGGGGSTIAGVGTVTASGSSTTEYQLQIGGHAQIPDASGFMNVITQIGDDDVVTGNLINLTSAKISRFTVGDEGGPNGNGTTPATMQAFIWSNATVGSSKLADLVVEASSDILNLNDFIFPQVPEFRENFDQRNDFYPVSFNFTGAPTLTGEYLLGFKFENMTGDIDTMGVGNTETSVSPNFLVEELEGVCIGNGTTFTDVLSSSCPTETAIVHAFTFHVAAEKTVSDLTVDTPIAPTKLKAYWTFDDNAVDGEIAINAGSLGHDADATMVRMLTLQSDTLNRNSTGGLIGASYNHTNCGGTGTSCIFNGTINFDPDFLQAGIFSNDKRGQWSFLHALGATANKTSVSMWVKFPSDAFGLPDQGIPLISSGSTQGLDIEDDGISYGIGPSDTEFTVKIKSNSTAMVDFAFDPLDSGAPDEFTFPGSTTSGPPHFDGEWHHLAFIVDKGNTTFPVKICIDGTSPVTVQSGCKFIPFDSPIDNSTKDPKYNLMLAPIFEAGGVSDQLADWEMDEVAIWEDYLLTDSEIDQIATMAVVTAGTSEGQIGTTSSSGTRLTERTLMHTDVGDASGGGAIETLSNLTNGRIGQTIELDSDSVIRATWTEFGSAVGSFGNLTGVIWTNVTADGATTMNGDEVEVVLSDESVNLTTFCQPQPTNGCNLIFNFTNAPSLSGTHVIGYKWDSLNASAAFGPSFKIEATYDKTDSFCSYTNVTSGFWDSCGTHPLQTTADANDDLMMEIIVNGTVDNRSVTTTIEPTKLIVYHTFDDADVDDTVLINSGTFGKEADGNFLFNLFNRTMINGATAKVGESLEVENDDAITDTFVSLGNMLNRNQWDFLHDNSTVTFSMAFQLEHTIAATDLYPIIGTIWEDDPARSQFVLKFSDMAGSNTLSLDVSNADDDHFMDVDFTLVPVPNDGVFHDIFLTYNKTVVAGGDDSIIAKICVDNSTNCQTISDTFANVFDNDPILTPTQIPLTIQHSFPISLYEIADIRIDELGIWKDHLLTDAQIDLIAEGSGVVGGTNTGVIVTDTVNAFISSTALNQTINDSVNVTDIQPIFNVTTVLDDNANVTDTVIISADFNQTVGTADNNVNVTDTVTIINSKNQTIPSGANIANITDSVILNFTKFLVGDQVDMTIANLTIVNATAPPADEDVPTGGPPTDAPESGVGSGGGGIPTSRVDPSLSASLTGLSISEPDHTLSTEIIINPFFSSGIEEGSVVLNWDQQEPVKITSITIPPEFEQFIDFTQEGEFQFAGAKADPTDTFSTGIIEYEVKIPSLALGVTPDTNPFGTAVTFDNFLQLAFFNEYTIPITVDAVHNGKPFSLDTTITVNHIKEVRWVVIAITIAGVAFLAVWGKSFFAGEATTKAGSFRKNLDKAKRATVDKQKRGSFRKELERQRRADRQNIKKLKKK